MKKRTIREAKIAYFDNLFTQYKGNIQKTWQTISVIICKSSTKRNMLDEIVMDSKATKDEDEICDKFNEFFTNIDPKLATQVRSISSETVDKNWVSMSFELRLVSEYDVIK